MKLSAVLAAAAVATVVTTLGAAAPAQADPGDVVVVTTNGPTSSVNKKGVFVDCPSGLKAYGGGGYIWNGSRRVHLAASTPVLDGNENKWWAGGSEIRPNDYTSSWRVHGYAICGPNLVGLEYVMAESASTSNSSNHASVTCPGTKKLLSAGGDITEQSEYVVLDDIAINSTLKTVDVWGVERENGTNMPWSVRAYGVCVNSNDVANLNRVQTTSAWSMLDKTKTTACDDDQQVYGMGAVQANSGGDTMFGSIVPTDVDGSVSVRNDPTGVSANWNITTQLVCGDE